MESCPKQVRFSRRLALTLLLGLAAAVPVAVSVAVSAAEPSPSTVITMGEMCGGCVKQITAKLQPMPGIAQVRCDMNTKSVTVVPQPGQTLSPRVLWESMEAIGKTPKKLAGPSGTFTAKPQK